MISLLRSVREQCELNQWTLRRLETANSSKKTPPPSLKVSSWVLATPATRTEPSSNVAATQEDAFIGKFVFLIESRLCSYIKKISSLTISDHLWLYIYFTLLPLLWMIHPCFYLVQDRQGKRPISTVYLCTSISMTVPPAVASAHLLSNLPVRFSFEKISKGLEYREIPLQGPRI